jgi:hypothetical protein
MPMKGPSEWAQSTLMCQGADAMAICGFNGHFCIVKTSCRKFGQFIAKREDDEFQTIIHLEFVKN